ncbi:restriction endonuclease subunit S [Veillonella sp.]
MYLKDLVDIQMGQSPDSKFYNNDKIGLPFYQGKADFGRINPIPKIWCSKSKKEAKPNDILISVRAPVGDLNINNEQSCIGRGLAAITCKSDVDMMYLYYHLKYLKPQLKHISTGSTFESINRSQLENLIIDYKPYFEQIKISNILQVVQRQIEVREKLLRLYDLLIKSRFDEFNKNNNNVKVSKLEALCTSIVRGPFGSALKVENFVKKSDTSVKVYEQSNAIQRSAAIGSRYISREHYESLRRFKCKPGDIIMSCSGTIGKLFILPNDAEEGIINQALCKFTLGKELLPEVFLLYMDILIDNIEIKGSGIKNISAVKFIKNFEIPVPPIGIQSKLLFELNQINKLKFAQIVYN